MKRFLSIALFVFSIALIAAPAARAQFVGFTASNITDASGHLLASGTLCLMPVDNSNHPVIARIGMTGTPPAPGGAVIEEQACTTITNGVLLAGFQAPDTALTAPLNLCLRVTITDDNQNGQTVYSASCVQPASSGPATVGIPPFCAWVGPHVYCDFDNYSPSLGALALVTTGPTGATGPAGAAGANGAAGPQGPAGTGSGGNVLYTCVNSSLDASGISTALAAGGIAQIKGTCDITTHITAPSGSYGDFTLATLTGNVGANDSMLWNAQHAQTIARTLTGCTWTTTSQTLTCPSGAFTASEANGTESLDLVGGYTNTTCCTTTDFYTTIASVTNSTTVVLTDIPFVAQASGTVNVRVRDKNITIKGGTWINNGATNSHPAIWIVTSLNTTIDGVSVAATGGQQSYAYYIEDSTNPHLTNDSCFSGTYGQDCVHFVGPAQGIVVEHLRGSVGDDFVALMPNDGATAQDSNEFNGNIDGVTLTDLVGAGTGGVSMYGPWPKYNTAEAPGAERIRNVSIRHVIGVQNYPNGTTQAPGGFGNGVALTLGNIDKVSIEDIGGYITGPVLSIAAPNVGDVTLTNVHPTTAACMYNGLPYTYGGMVTVAGNSQTGTTAANSHVTSLTIDGVHSGNYHIGNYVTVKQGNGVYGGGAVDNLVVRNVDDANDTCIAAGGTWAYISPYSNGGNYTFDNWNISANVTSSPNDLFHIQQPGAGTFNGTITATNIHVYQQSGSAALNSLFYFQGSNGSDILSNDSFVAATATSADTFLSTYWDGYTSTLATLQESNVYVNNIGTLNNTVNSNFTITNPPQITNAVCTNLTTPASCSAQNYVPNITITTGTTTVPAAISGVAQCLPSNSTFTSVAMPGLTSTVGLTFTPQTTGLMSIAGWDSGTLFFNPQTSSPGTLLYQICNAGASAQTPGGSVTWTVSAQNVSN